MIRNRLKDGYEKVMYQIKEMILYGNFDKNRRLPSVRDLATLYGVNHNTIQRALRELEYQGIVVKTPGVGVDIVDDVIKLKKVLLEEVMDDLRDILLEVQKLGVSKEDIGDILKENK